MGRGDGGSCRRRQGDRARKRGSRDARMGSDRVRSDRVAGPSSGSAVTDVRRPETTGSCRGGRRSSVFSLSVGAWPVAWGPGGSMPVNARLWVPHLHHRRQPKGPVPRSRRCVRATARRQRPHAHAGAAGTRAPTSTSIARAPAAIPGCSWTGHGLCSLGSALAPRRLNDVKGGERETTRPPSPCADRARASPGAR